MNSSISLNSAAGIEHDAVADQVHHARAEDADGQQVGGVFLAADADGVAGVGAAAVADDDVGVLGEEIDDLALALVAPLQADDAGIAFEKRCHSATFSREKRVRTGKRDSMTVGRGVSSLSEVLPLAASRLFGSEQALSRKRQKKWRCNATVS